jgi:hypothetical protein
MKRLLPIFISLALMITYGGEKDHDDDHDTPVTATNAPSQRKAEPEPTGPQYCFPTNYSVPSGSSDSTNRVVTTTQTIGTPDDAYYRITVTTETLISTTYGDGTSYTVNGTAISDTIASTGTTNSTLSKDEQTSIVLFDNTKLTSDLIEHATDGTEDQYQYNAFLECSDGAVTAITKEQFNVFKAQIGL